MEEFLSSAEIGSKIKLYRQKAGITQEGLAEILGVSFQQIQNYENGKNKLNTDKIQLLCNALNISPSMLFSETKMQHYTLSSEEESLIAYFRAIKSEDKKECVIVLANALRKQRK